MILIDPGRNLAGYIIHDIAIFIRQIPPRYDVGCCDEPGVLTTPEVPTVGSFMGTHTLSEGCNILPNCYRMGSNISSTLLYFQCWSREMSVSGGRRASQTGVSLSTK